MFFTPNNTVTWDEVQANVGPQKNNLWNEAVDNTGRKDVPFPRWMLNTN